MDSIISSVNSDPKNKESFISDYMKDEGSIKKIEESIKIDLMDGKSQKIDKKVSYNQESAIDGSDPKDVRLSRDLKVSKESIDLLT